MQQPFGTLIATLWIVWLAYWVVSAAAVKPTARSESVQSRLLYSVPLWIGAWLLFGGADMPEVLRTRFLPDTAAIAILGTAMTAAGLVFAVWARVILGSNWSGMVTVKEGHELVERGPYTLVRHPIYTGLIFGLLGTAIATGEWRGIVAIVLVIGSCWYKLRTEERMMRETFGAAYDDYARRVRALVPFLI